LNRDHSAGQTRQTSGPGTVWAQRIFSHIPPGQFGRYLAVGAFNTAFGYGVYAAFTALLTPYVPFAYVAASVLANFVNITVAFLNYKLLIFKTQGNYLREWARCVVVYSGGMVASVVFLPVFVFLLRHFLNLGRYSPYVAGAILTALTVVASFLGHKHYSFAASRSRIPARESPVE